MAENFKYKATVETNINYVVIRDNRTYFVLKHFGL